MTVRVDPFDPFGLGRWKRQIKNGDGLSLATSVGFRLSVPATPVNTPPVLTLPDPFTVEADTTGGWNAAFNASAMATHDG